MRCTADPGGACARHCHRDQEHEAEQRPVQEHLNVRPTRNWQDSLCKGTSDNDHAHAQTASGFRLTMRPLSGVCVRVCGAEAGHALCHGLRHHDWRRRGSNGTWRRDGHAQSVRLGQHESSGVGATASNATFGWIHKCVRTWTTANAFWSRGFHSIPGCCSSSTRPMHSSAREPQWVGVFFFLPLNNFSWCFAQDNIASVPLQEKISEDLRATLNAFLYRTGEQSNK